MADTTFDAHKLIADQTYELGAQLAKDIANAFAAKGISLSRAQLGMMASGFTVGATSAYSAQAVADGNCPSCAQIEFLSMAHFSLGGAVAKLTSDAPMHGKAH